MAYYFGSSWVKGHGVWESILLGLAIRVVPIEHIEELLLHDSIGSEGLAGSYLRQDGGQAATFRDSLTRIRLSARHAAESYSAGATWAVCLTSLT